MYDEAWLARLQADSSFSDGTGRQRLVDNSSSESWLSLAARWSALESVSQLEREFRLSSRVGNEIAEVPIALLQTQEGPVLLFEDRGILPLASAENPIPVRKWLEVAVSATDALAKLHSHNVIHCAIDSVNIRHRPNGDIVFAGFGRAIDIDDAQDRPRAASDLSLPYASPELADRADPQGDARSDLYSLGATLYELLTSQRLFNVSTPAEWLHAHVAMRPRRPSAIRAGVPEQLDAILLRLLAKNPADRYSSAAALSADLKICQRMLEEMGEIRSFPLHGRIGFARKPITHVIGREAQLHALREAAHRVETVGNAEIVIIEGAPGLESQAWSNTFGANFPAGPVLPESAIRTKGKPLIFR